MQLLGCRDSGRPAVILLVEDNENDMILTREAFTSAEVRVDLRHVETGEQCLEFLRKQGGSSQAPTPDLVLLDLNMPVMNGREVMEALVADPSLDHLPVVILTTSTAPGDIRAMYRLRCNSYMVKPMGFTEFVDQLRSLYEYWFRTVTLPPASDPAPAAASLPN